MEAGHGPPGAAASRSHCQACQRPSLGPLQPPADSMAGVGIQGPPALQLGSHHGPPACKETARCAGKALHLSVAAEGAVPAFGHPVASSPTACHVLQQHEGVRFLTSCRTTRLLLPASCVCSSLRCSWSACRSMPCSRSLHLLAASGASLAPPAGATPPCVLGGDGRPGSAVCGLLVLPLLLLLVLSLLALEVELPALVLPLLVLPE